MTRTLNMLVAITLLCWPALNDPARVEAHRAYHQKREKLYLRKAMNAEEVRQLYFQSE